MNYKSILRRALACAALTSVFAANALAADVSVLVNGTPYPGSSFISDGHIYVPLRSFCESLGYRVRWSGARRAATVTAGDTEAVFPGSIYPIRESSLYAPLRTLTGALGGRVSWEENTASAHVELKPAGASEESASREARTGSYTEDELIWLARIVYAEAGGESMEGKIAVANTVLERASSEQYPDTIYGVIFDDKYGVQYEPVSNGTIYNTPDADSYEAAQRALEGEKAVEGCLFFFNPEKASSSWIAENRTYVTTIGHHVFYA